MLPVKTRSFGGIGVFAIPEMGRFYRHVLIQKRYPHHGAVAFGHYGKALFEIIKFLGMRDIAYNQPRLPVQKRAVSALKARAGGG
jgi:L-fucose isomerase-like protein